MCLARATHKIMVGEKSQNSDRASGSSKEQGSKALISDEKQGSEVSTSSRISSHSVKSVSDLGDSERTRNINQPSALKYLCRHAVGLRSMFWRVPRFNVLHADKEHSFEEEARIIYDFVFGGDF